MMGPGNSLEGGNFRRGVCAAPACTPAQLKRRDWRSHEGERYIVMEESHGDVDRTRTMMVLG